MIDFFTYTFLIRALIAGILIAILGGYYGVFVVQRKLSFLGDGLAHSAFGGVALALLLQTEPLWIAIPFTIMISLLITYIHEKTKIASDTAIGIFFAVSVALGIIFISLKKDYSVDAFNFLFGSILGISNADIYTLILMIFLSLLTLPKMWGHWAYATFDRELAKADRLKTSLDDYILSILIALTIVISIKIVGIILVASFIIIPSASARLISKTFAQMTFLSIIISISSAVIGLFLSYYLDLPTGAVIILLQALIFFTFTLFKR